jgi:anti-sigma factor RsiW
MIRPCRGFLLSISALADDNLDSTSTPAVRAHLADCPDCARVYAEQRKLSGWLRVGLPDAEPAPQIWTRIESRLRVPRRSRWQRLGSGLAAVVRFPEVRYVAASLLLLALLSGGFMGRVEEAQPVPRIYAKAENPFLVALERETFPSSLARRAASGENPFDLTKGVR